MVSYNPSTARFSRGSAQDMPGRRKVGSGYQRLRPELEKRKERRAHLTDPTCIGLAVSPFLLRAQRTWKQHAGGPFAMPRHRSDIEPKGQTVRFATEPSCKGFGRSRPTGGSVVYSCARPQHPKLGSESMRLIAREKGFESLCTST